MMLRLRMALAIAKCTGTITGAFPPRILLLHWVDDARQGCFLQRLATYYERRGG